MTTKLTILDDAAMFLFLLSIHIGLDWLPAGAEQPAQQAQGGTKESLQCFSYGILTSV